MTVKDLIEQLRDLPETARVAILIPGEDGFGDEVDLDEIRYDGGEAELWMGGNLLTPPVESDDLLGRVVAALVGAFVAVGFLRLWR